jgi:glutathione S-transferase
LWTHQLQLTIADFVLEVHDTHHPISSALYYEQQKPAAKRRTQDFLDSRVPKFLRYFETRHGAQ